MGSFEKTGTSVKEGGGGGEFKSGQVSTTVQSNG